MIWTTPTVAALALLAAIGLYGAFDGYRDAAAARAERDDLTAQLTAEKRRTQALRANVLAATAKANAARHSLKEALDAAPEYRDTPVPVPVRDSLCSTLRCK